MTSYKSSFQNAAWDAYHRLTKVAEGLAVLCGYADPFPTTVQQFDELCSLARRAAAWAAGVLRGCNTFAIPVSVRGVGQDWETGKKSGVWKLNISRDMLPANESNYRLRGIAAIADFDGVHALTLRVSPPTGARVYRRSRDGSEEYKDVKQSAPSCRIGRVLKIDSDHAPEIVGQTTLHNMS